MEIDIQEELVSTDAGSSCAPVDYEITAHCSCRQKLTAFLSELEQSNPCPNCGQTWLTVNPIGGWVYVLKNVRMPGLVKIGHTFRPVAERLAELNAPTSVPEPFYVRAIFAANDPVSAEAEIHRVLEVERLQGREFFELEDEMVLDVCKEICGRAPLVIAPDPATEEVMPSTCKVITIAKKDNMAICPKCKRRLMGLQGGQGWQCDGCNILFDADGAALLSSKSIVSVVKNNNKTLCPKCQKKLLQLKDDRGWECKGCNLQFNTSGLAILG